MRSPKDMSIIQIEITNACRNRCANCTRFCGHQKTPFFMDFETFKKAVDSMKGFTGIVGIMGGEPTLHPEFKRFVTYFKDNFGSDTPSKVYKGPEKDFLRYICNNIFNISNNNQRGLWSSMGVQYYNHFEIIQDTFGYQVLNDHSHPSMHETLMVTRKELGIPDKKWLKLRDECWVQNLWSASITPKGAFFCEIAAAMDMLLDGPGGWEIEPGWWERKPKDFKDQLHWCELCSAPLAMPKRDANLEIDDASPKWCSILSEIQSPKFLKGKVKEFDVNSYDEQKYTIINEGNPYLPDQTKRFSQKSGKLEPHAIDIWLDLRDVDTHEGLEIVHENQKITEINGILVTDEEEYDCFLPLNYPLIRIPKIQDTIKISDIVAEFKPKDFVIILRNYVLKGNPRDVIQHFVYNPGVFYYYKDNCSDFSLFCIRAYSLESNPGPDKIKEAYPEDKQVRLQKVPDYNVAIYQVCHKPSTLLENEIFHPIHAGKAIYPGFSSVPGDDTGEHISFKNETYSEFTALYWIWKNDTTHEYLGLCHYRRILIFNKDIVKTIKKDRYPIKRLMNSDIEKFGWDPGSVLEHVQDADIIVGRNWNEPIGGSQESHYLYMHGKEQYQRLLEGVLTYAPEYYPFLKEYFEGKKLRTGHLFIMRRDLLNSYCEWLFPLLEKIIPSVDFTKRDTYNIREHAFAAERLFHIYLEKLKQDHQELIIHELPFVLVEDTTPVISSIPELQVNMQVIPIITAFDTNFISVFSVFLESLKSVSSPEYHYDVIILSDSVSDYHQKVIKKQIKPHENITIRFFEMSNYLLKESLNFEPHFAKSTFFRLKLPSLLSEYKKIIYLDPDLILLKNPAYLYQENFTDCYAGVVRCINTMQPRLSNFQLPTPYNQYDLQGYFEKELGLSPENIENYFNAGVMVLNLEKIRNDGLEEQFLSLFYSKNYYLVDQDILNIAFNGTVTLLPQNWNLICLPPSRPLTRVPYSYVKQYEEAMENPYIIHYASPYNKPWLNDTVPYGEIFWMYARKSPYYEILLKQYLTLGKESGDSSKVKTQHKTAKIKIRNYVRRNFSHYLPYIRFIRRKTNRLYCRVVYKQSHD